MKNIEKKEAVLKISQEEMDFINNLLKLDGEKIYQKYGLKRDETITHTVNFGDEIEADIKLVICEEGEPYTEGVLFDSGTEVSCSDCYDEYEGLWEFEYNDTQYCIEVQVDKNLEKENDSVICETELNELDM